ncbi:MAG: hypothetical protein SFY67_05540 [Candidatus Melainabacteria bacterium]|nr:hypothetical protein [Candidatus Melainabacteria bacterium]
MKTLNITKIRDFNIEPTRTERPDYVFAASGLVKLGDTIYVVADDELHLAEFDLKDLQKPGKWFRLLPGELPLQYKPRKKIKPDLEALTYLKPYQYAPYGALLAVPSMSRENRVEGVLLVLDKNLKISGEPLPVDFSLLQKHLAVQFSGLNIEGITVNKETARLYQRGNRKQGQNALIDFKAKDFLRDLHDTHCPDPEKIFCVKEFDVGKIEEQVLGFTDAICLDEENILFLAAAEDTDDAYQDGKCFGSAIGLMNANGTIKGLLEIEGKQKFEGLCLKAQNKNMLEIFLTIDTDDEKKPSALYMASLNLKDFETRESALPFASETFV